MKSITKKELIHSGYAVAFLPDDWLGDALDVLNLSIKSQDKIWGVLSFYALSPDVLREFTRWCIWQRMKGEKISKVLQLFLQFGDKRWQKMVIQMPNYEDLLDDFPFLILVTEREIETQDNYDFYYEVVYDIVQKRLVTWEQLEEKLRELLEKDLVSFRGPTPKEVEYAKSLQPIADKYLEETAEETILGIIDQKDIF